MSTLTVGTISEKVTDAGVAVDGVTLKDGDVTIADKIIHDGDTNTTIRFPSADTVTIETGGSERARVDSSGNLLVGATTTTNMSDGTGNDGVALNPVGTLVGARTSNVSLVLNRLSTDGAIANFNKDGSSVGSIGANGTQPYFINSNANSGIRIYSNGIAPATTNGAFEDNAQDIGSSSVRWDDIYATNGTIQTSDRNEKQDIEELSEAEQRVAVVAKGLMRKFRWRDAVAEKGDNARTHFGIIAQDLQDAFTAEGLDAGNYAMFTSNTWWEKEISVDAVEADEENGIEAQDAYTYMDIKEEATEGYTEKTRLGVRYSELLAFIISAL